MYKMNNYNLIIIIIILYKIFNIINIYSVDFILNSLYDIITNLDFATKIDFFKNPIKNIEYIPELPILTIYNRDKYIEWHIYYENIYKKRVQNDVNLNEFTLFYWNKLPLKDLKIYTINGYYLFNYNIDKINNVCWTGLYGPEQLCYEYGFFVKRSINKKMFNNKQLEVFRVDLSVSKYNNIKFFKEESCIWYFHTIGSGIFIPNYENKLILNDKINWNQNSYFNEIDINAIYELKKK